MSLGPCDTGDTQTVLELPFLGRKGKTAFFSKETNLQSNERLDYADDTRKPRGSRSMGVHWKFGDGFAIRYGGCQDIQWFFGPEFQQTARLLPLPSLHPAMMVLNAAQAAGSFLIWWEVRKQTQISTAQFEERRIAWLGEMLAQLYTEMREEGTVRLDTIRYLERELSRVIEALNENDKMDLPSSLLLQIERTAKTLAVLNKFVRQELLQESSHLPSADERLLIPEYQSYQEITSDYVSDEGVLSNALGALGRVPSAISDSVGSAVRWGVQTLSELHKKDRGDEYRSLQALVFELSNAQVFLSLVRAYPLAMLGQQIEELRAGRAPEFIFIDAQNHPRLLE
jgi:hypothetical protein